MIANKEKCADNDKSVCDYNEFRRLRYFHGMLLDDKDFKAEQDYHTRKRRFLNRMLHGWGVVCGLELSGKSGGRSIELSSGFALDCAGNEIWVPHEKPLDLASLIPAKDRGRREGECVEQEPNKPNTYYIGIRYEEKPSDPVSVYMPSGSCEERTCENSRVKEGYCIELLSCPAETDPKKSGLISGLCGCTPDYTKPEDKELPVCPEHNKADPKELCQGFVMEEFCEKSVPCPECCSCEKPCFVILGKIEVSKECKLVSVCMNNCRRYVVTFRMLQHMLQWVFAGALGENGYFKMKDDKNNNTDLPADAYEWIHNPIKALCYWLPYKVNGGGITWLGCGKSESTKEEEPLAKAQKDLAQAQFAIKKLEKDFAALQGLVTQGQQIVKTDSIIITDADTAKDQQTAPEKPAGTKKEKTPTKPDQT